MNIYTLVVLALSGLLLMFVGATRLRTRQKTYAKNSGINLPDDVDLLNEVRGVSAVMLGAGAILLVALAVSPLRVSALVVATLVFGGFAIGRTLSLRLDGKPNKLLVQGLTFEVVFCALNAVALVSAIA